MVNVLAKRALTVTLVLTLLCLTPAARADPVIDFGTYTTFTSEYLDLSFDVPKYFGLPVDHSANSNTIIFSEPINDIRSGSSLPASLTVQVNRMSTKQNLKNAQTVLSQFLEAFHAQFPDMWIENMTTIEVMGQPSACVLYGVEIPVSDTSSETLPMKGRCIVVPGGQTLFLIRALSPEDAFDAYDAGVMEQALATFTDLTASTDDAPSIFFLPYKTYQSDSLGISFDVPSYMEGPLGYDGVSDTTTLVFSEPLDDIRSGEAVAASLTVQVNELATDMTMEDAQQAMTQFFDSFQAQFPSLWIRNLPPVTAMGVEAENAGYGLLVPLDDENMQDPLYLKGRCIIVPKGNRLYMIRFLCPADQYDAYVPGLLDRVLDTIAES